METDWIIIKGQCPSKSNQYKIVTIKPKNRKPYSSLAKSKQVKAFEKLFIEQLKKYDKPETFGYFMISIFVYFDNVRSDIDNALKVLLDILQSQSWIINDSFCQEIRIQKKIDTINPRIRFKLYSTHERV